MTNKYIEIIKNLEDMRISVSDLMIWQEIYDNADAHKLNAIELDILYNTVERVWFKSEEPLNLTRVVNYCIDHMNKLYDMSICQIISEVI